MNSRDRYALICSIASAIFILLSSIIMLTITYLRNQP